MPEPNRRTVFLSTLRFENILHELSLFVGFYRRFIVTYGLHSLELNVCTERRNKPVCVSYITIDDDEGNKKCLS